ncbi:putative gnat family [Diaporthe ampelina]|uniref:Putative gnat family n=1 Tax=Diaporthe ampelina TaxID=1214573 RepID=A0A0G2HK28_9PEZI|nr:putative gnat family [Diaporthe ampelina]
MAEAFLNDLESVWRSERLVFRATQQEDYEFLFSEIDTDPINVALSGPMLLKPPRKQKPEDWYEKWGKHDFLMDVIICLRPDVQSNERHLKSSAVSEKDGDQTDKAQAKPIGMINVSTSVYGRNPTNRACSLGITIAAPYQNCGYGTEAVRWTIDWAFRRANMHSVHLGSVEYNTRAHRCYQKAGFKLDGKQRECYWNGRQFWDLYLFSILEHEWEQLQEGQK